MYSLRKRIGWEFFGLNLCQRSAWWTWVRGLSSAPKFLCLTSSSVGGREKTAYEHQVEQGGALSEPNKHIEERFEPVTATNQLWGLAEQGAQKIVNCCCRYKPKGGGWDIDPKLEYGTKPVLHERLGQKVERLRQSRFLSNSGMALVK